MSVADTFRQLVSDYYHGLISQETYRRRRADLLENLASQTHQDQVTVPRGDPETLLSASRPTVRQNAFGKLVGAIAENDQHKRILAAASVAVLALLVTIIVAWVVSSDSDKVAAVEPQVAAADGVLREFLTRGDWSAASSGTLISAWLGFEDSERDRARHTTVYLSFENELRSRIRLEKNLSNGRRDVARLDDGRPLLQTLATELGFERLVATEFDLPVTGQD